MNRIIMEVTVGPNHTMRLFAPKPYPEWVKERNGVYRRDTTPDDELERLYAKKVTTHYRKCGQAVRAFMKQENPKRQRRMKVCQIKNRNY